MTSPADPPPVRQPGRPGDDPGGSVVEVRRSQRRRRTVSAYREGERVVVLLPARMSRAEEQRWVTLMLERLDRQRQRTRPSEPELLARAETLSRRYLGGAARPASVAWSRHQEHRWGSCTVADGTIRLSSRLRGMPRWVTDYVLVHELAHLLEAGHTSRFWRLVSAYPRAERARGFLEGVAASDGPPIDGEDDSTVDPVDDAD